jgi:hypothetical protein
LQRTSTDSSQILEFHFFKEKRMVDFHKKLLGLGLLVSAFTGMSYGQILCPGAPAPGYQIQPGLAANLLRFEGTTEQVASVTVYCAAGSTVSSGTVQATIAVAGFQPQITSPTGDPLLIIQATTGVFGNGTPPAPPPVTGNPTSYTGTIAGSQVTFTNVAFPNGAFLMSVYNIRVNASALAPLVQQTQVNESILVTQAGVGVFAPPAQLVGLLYQGFKVQPISGVTNYLICKGSPTVVNGNTTTAGVITITGLFNAAFKSRTPLGLNGTQLCNAAACTTTNGEQGNSVPPGTVAALGTQGAATHGTRFQVAFAGLAQGVTLSVPTTITNGTLTAQLVTSATGPISLAGTGVLTTSAGGTATAVYEITQTDNTVFNESFSISVTATALANFSTAAVPAFTATVSVAPQQTVNNLEDIPNFSAPSTTLNLAAYSLCQTTLLFPFVSTAGVETGIALSNTSSDPGLVGGVVGGTATPSQGSCTLTFYGTNSVAAGTPLTPITVPAPDPGFPTKNIQPTGTSNSFAIGATGLVPSGFSGYMIAQCNYLYAHGFAYIAYQLGTTIGSTMGYTANVLTNRPIGSGVVVATETVTN